MKLFCILLTGVIIHSSQSINARDIQRCRWICCNVTESHQTIPTQQNTLSTIKFNSRTTLVPEITVPNDPFNINRNLFNIVSSVNDLTQNASLLSNSTSNRGNAVANGGNVNIVVGTGLSNNNINKNSTQAYSQKLFISSGTKLGGDAVSIGGLTSANGGNATIISG